MYYDGDFAMSLVVGRRMRFLEFRRSMTGLHEIAFTYSEGRIVHLEA